MINKKSNPSEYSSTVNRLLELNDKFRNKNLLLEENFYMQLEIFGCEIDKSFIIDIFPDSGSTYTGTIINQNMKILAFDIDTNFSEYSIISEKTNLSANDKIALKIFQQVASSPHGALRNAG
ncbi:hypothetical protein BAC3_00967 [uncultured bacterium]|nr:hypothetical protein BAC3_00967 [uncultured bacterium]